MEKIECFDYLKVAREMKVSPPIIKRIEKEVREEFPSDQMLYKLHVLRALKSKNWEKEGFVT